MNDRELRQLQKRLRTINNELMELCPLHRRAVELQAERVRVCSAIDELVESSKMDPLGRRPGPPRRSQ